MFDEVYIMSPIETTNTYKYGMYISKETTQSFKKKVKSISPDLIRVYGAYWPSDFIAKVRPRNTPVVLSIHDSHPSMIFHSSAFSDHLICMSSVVEDTVIKKTNVNKKRFIRLPNRVDTSVFYPQAEKKKIQALFPSLPEGKAILHVGRKSIEKNINTVISSLNHLPKDYFCIFVGQGNKDKYTEQAKNQEVEDRCFWIDSINNSDLADWYNACSCLCVPSLWEGFGIVFIEAAACGTPIITSNIQPMSEYLKHKESAYLVNEYKSPEALAHAIREVCNNEELRQKITTNAVIAAAPFDKNKVDEDEKNIYLSLFDKTTLSNFDWFNLLVWRLKTRCSAFLSIIIFDPIKTMIHFSVRRLKSSLKIKS